MRYPLAALLAYSLLVFPLLANEQTTEAAARERLTGLAEAVGGNPEADFSAAVPQVFSSAMIERVGEERLQEIMSMMANDGFGRLEILSSRWEEEEGRWVFGVRNADGNPATIHLHLAPDENYRISNLGIQMGMPVEVPSVSPEEFPEAIAAFLEEHAAGFSGTVLVARDGKPVFTGAYGLADRASGRPMTLDTPMNLGSINKMFTGIAIAQLVEAGKLDWNDTVGKFLPDYPNETVRNKATIAQLLNHSSGVPSYWNEAYFENRKSLSSQQDYLDTFKNEPLDFEPGTQWKYSNGGPVILGRIIEVITGEDYYAYIRKHIYQPLGMNNTDHYRRDARNKPYAIGYWPGEEPREDGELVPNSDWLGVIGSAAGGGYASAPDLLKLAEALLSSELLKPETLQVMWRDIEVAGKPTGYGFLVGVDEQNGHRKIGHTGGAPGVNASFHFYPQSGYTVIVLSNHDNGARHVARWVEELISSNIQSEF